MDKQIKDSLKTKWSSVKGKARQGKCAKQGFMVQGDHKAHQVGMIDVRISKINLGARSRVLAIILGWAMEVTGWLAEQDEPESSKYLMVRRIVCAERHGKAKGHVDGKEHSGTCWLYSPKVTVTQVTRAEHEVRMCEPLTCEVFHKVVELESFINQ